MNKGLIEWIDEEIERLEGIENKNGLQHRELETYIRCRIRAEELEKELIKFSWDNRHSLLHQDIVSGKSVWKDYIKRQDLEDFIKKKFHGEDSLSQPSMVDGVEQHKPKRNSDVVSNARKVEVPLDDSDEGEKEEWEQ